MKSPAPLSKSTLVYALLVLILAAYVALRINNLSQAVQKVKSATDTASYVRVSQEPFFSRQFLAASRPPVFPLLLKLFGNDEEKVAWAQGIFSILSWSMLAVALAYSLHTPLLKLAGFGLILLLSLDRYILGWDAALLTESLSISLLALFLASWLWLARGWHWGKVLFLLVVAFFWTFSRDTNAWVVFMIAFFLLLLLALRLLDRKYLILSAAFLLMFLLSNLSADGEDRWIFPFQNVLGHRILPNQQATDFFGRCGMPVSPELTQMAGKFSHDADRALYEDPALDDYRVWLYQSGKACYMKWLLSNPLESIKAPLAEFDTLISMRNLRTFLFSKRFSPVLPGRLEAILFPRRYLLPLFALTLAAVLAAIALRVWTKNNAWWVVIAFNLLIFPHYFITWHGDVMGIYRHVLSASIQFYLGAWLLVLFVLDTVLSSRMSALRNTKT